MIGINSSTHQFQCIRVRSYHLLHSWPQYPTLLFCFECTVVGTVSNHCSSVETRESRLFLPLTVFEDFLNPSLHTVVGVHIQFTVVISLTLNCSPSQTIRYADSHGLFTITTWVRTTLVLGNSRNTLRCRVESLFARCQRDMALSL